MPPPPLLTIAIPTYNRRHFLSECLAHILPQVTPGVDILICDNASTDGTEEIGRAAAAQHPFLRYRRNERNLGMDGNFLACLQNAHGRYVLIFSDDDILLPGSVGRILERIKEQPDLAFLHLNYCGFEKNFNPAALGPPAYPTGEDIIYSDMNLLLEKVFIMATFISCLVYNRSRFLSVHAPERFIGTHLLISHVLLETLPGGGPYVVISHLCVASRRINRADYSFFKVFGYEWYRVLFETGSRLGFRPGTLKSIYRRTIRGHLLYWTIQIKTNNTVFRLNGLIPFFRATARFPESWLYLYPVLLTPAPVFSLVQKAVKRFRSVFSGITGKANR